MNRLLPFFCLLLISVGCNETAKKDKHTGWADYDLSSPEKYNMGSNLLEISGIALNEQRADTIYAIEDETGKLYHFAWKDQERKRHTKFGKGGDYEDVAIVRGNVYVLKSNGTLYTFPLKDAIYEEIDSAAEVKGLLPDGEYEGIYGDDRNGKLYVLCKNCTGKEQRETVRGYIFTTDNGIVPAGQFEIDVESIKPFSGNVKKGFRPSGLARRPSTNEWLIISGVNKLLVVTDSAWKVKAAYPLNGNVFNQPEGIAIDQQSNLYISNEGDDIIDGNILKFTYKPKQ